MCERQVPIRRNSAGDIECDICPQPATVIRPETKNRELAYYCAYDADRSLGWGDTFRVMT